MDGTISLLIAAAERGDPGARDALFGALYRELHGLAQRELARHGAAPVGVTTLLHEAYMAMAGRESLSFPDRARFMGYAAHVMRGLIIDRARERRTIKRGRFFEITSLGTDAAEVVDHQQLSGISDALEELAKAEPELAEIVDLKFFCGFSTPEIAAMSGNSERTVHRRWEKARTYLHQYLRPIEDTPR